MVRSTTAQADSEASRQPFLWRRRVGLMPFYLAVGATILGLSSLLITVPQTVLLVAVLTAALMIGSQSKWGKKRDRGARNLAWATILIAATYVLVIRIGGLPLTWVVTGTIVAIAVLGAFWWTDHSNIQRIKMERELIERWPVFAKTIGIPSVHRTAGKVTDTGRRWTLWWEPGSVRGGRKMVMGLGADLESYLGVADGKLKFEPRYMEGSPHKVDPNAVDIVEYTDSVINKQPVSFDGPTMRSIKDPMYIGAREDNTRHEVTWYSDAAGGMHTLAAGATGSGKSGLMSLTFAESCYVPDAVRWGIDAKGGMELRPWSPIFDWIIDDADDSIYMLKAVKAILDDRSKYAATMGWKNWKASPEHPVLIVVVDEAAEVFGIASFELNELSNSVARRGRAAGVLFFVLTQHPTTEALGSTQFTKNLRRRFCFSVEDDGAQRVVLPNSSGKVDATAIPIHPDYAGTYYSSEGGLLCEKSGRVRWVTEQDIYLLMLEVGAPGSTKGPVDLDSVSITAARRGSMAEVVDEDDQFAESVMKCMYDERYIWTIKDLIPPDGWTGITPEQVINGSAPAPGGVAPGAPAPATGAPGAPGAPLPDLSPDVPGAPRAYPGAPGAPDPDGIPYPEGPDLMDLADLVEPRTKAEADDLAAAQQTWERENTETPVSPARAQQMLDELLDAAPPHGTTIEEMRKSLVRSPSWYSEALSERTRRSTVVRLERGFYRRPDGYQRSQGLRVVPPTGDAR